jgi:hypothetical protein
MQEALDRETSALYRQIEARDRELKHAESRIEALSETINVERSFRNRREFALAREAWQAALGPELLDDEREFRRWYAEANDLTIEPGEPE